MDGSTSVLPHNTEKYIAIEKYLKYNVMKLRFIDSYKFMAASLETLASNLTDLNILPTQFTTLTNNQETLLRRKGVFPYDYIDSWEKLEETNLPPKIDFFNNMTMEHISDENYQHAQNVWREFDIKTLGNN